VRAGGCSSGVWDRPVPGFRRGQADVPVAWRRPVPGLSVCTGVVFQTAR
jgi:hypothetical protein